MHKPQRCFWGSNKIQGGNMMKQSLLAISILTSLLVLSGPASADTLFTIDNPNVALSGFAGPYATADVHLVDATHATITFTSLTTNGITFLMGGAQAVDVNVNATSWTVGSLVTCCTA